MVSPFTILLARVAGRTFVEHTGVFAHHDFHHFPVCFLVPAEGHVLAFEQAVRLLAAGTNLLVEL
jgi:hypothetical protein